MTSPSDKPSPEGTPPRRVIETATGAAVGPIGRRNLLPAFRAGAVAVGAGARRGGGPDGPPQPAPSVRRGRGRGRRRGPARSLQRRYQGLVVQLRWRGGGQDQGHPHRLGPPPDRGPCR